MRSLGKATAAIPLRDGPVLRRDFAQTLKSRLQELHGTVHARRPCPSARILKGTKPSDLLVQCPTSMLILNLKTAKVLGITVHWSFKLDRQPAAVNVASSRLYLALMSPPASGACKTSKTMLMRMLPTA